MVRCQSNPVLLSVFIESNICFFLRIILQDDYDEYAMIERDGEEEEEQNEQRNEMQQEVSISAPLNPNENDFRIDAIKCEFVSAN